MENTYDVNRKIVLGLGNTLNRDEGLGVHALKALEQHIAGQAPGVEFLDGGALGLNLLPWVEEASHLLVLELDGLALYTSRASDGTCQR